MTVRFPYAAISRAQDTAIAARGGSSEMVRYGASATVDEPHALDHFRDFLVWCEGREVDAARAFMTNVA